MNTPLHPALWDWSFVTAVLYAPLVEELTFRGAVMTALQTRTRFPMANLLTGFLFLMIHFPSWYLEGGIMADWMTFASSALGILLLGWILGYVAHRSKSVAASTLTHMLNNLFQRFVG
jgi:membrane protease YdiL (CAAX protease family)